MASNIPEVPIVVAHETRDSQKSRYYVEVPSDRIADSYNNFGEALQRFVGFHRGLKPNRLIDLQTRGLTPVEIDTVKTIADMHNQLEEILETFRKRYA